MLGKLFQGLLLCLFGASLAQAEETGNALEISPLKAVVGQPSVAFLGSLARGVDGRIFAEYIRQNVERDDFEDTTFRLQTGIELPLRGLEGYFAGLIVGAGLGYEYGLIGKSSERAYISSMRPEDKGSDDRWVNEVHYLTAYQSIGYRYFVAEYMSVAMRFVIDELLQERSRTESEEVLSYTADTSAESRPAVTQSISLFAGFHF